MLVSVLIGGALGGAYGHAFVKRISVWLANIKNTGDGRGNTFFLLLRFCIDYLSIGIACFLFTRMLHLDVVAEGISFLGAFGLAIWYWTRRLA